MRTVDMETYTNKQVVKVIHSTARPPYYLQTMDVKFHNQSFYTINDLFILNVFIVRGLYFLVDFRYKETYTGPEFRIRLGTTRKDSFPSEFFIKHRLAVCRANIPCPKYK